jgi:hypothetical protein
MEIFSSFTGRTAFGSGIYIDVELENLMKTLNYFFLIAIIIFVIPGIGCSGNTNVAPDLSDQENSRIGSSPSSRQFMGYSLIELDTESGKTDVIPVRAGNLHLNVTGILNNTMGVGVALVPGESDIPNGYVVLDVSLTHPLSNPKFSGFDVKGILIVHGTQAIGPLNFPGVNGARLNNADGYTRWWNPTEFTDPGLLGYTKGKFAPDIPTSWIDATINPYKYFADALFSTSTMSAVQNAPLDADDGRGIFSAGAGKTP